MMQRSGLVAAVLLLLLITGCAGTVRLRSRTSGKRQGRVVHSEMLTAANTAETNAALLAVKTKMQTRVKEREAMHAQAQTQVQRLPCLNDCSRGLATDKENGAVRGVCIKGVCRCNRGFFGEDCSYGNGTGTTGHPGISAKVTNEEACDSKDCNFQCAYGGACIDPNTCQCYNMWGKGPTDFRAGRKKQPEKITCADQKPLAMEERGVLYHIFRELGAPLRHGDPCLNGAAWKNGLGTPSVICNLCGHVEKLDLGRTYLAGTIGPSIKGLKYLVDLYLNNNNLQGTIPRELGALTSLQNLALNKNKLVGKVPPAIGRLRNLDSLVLYGNFLTGMLPKEIGQLYRLRVLDVSFNKLDKGVPSTIGNLMMLRTLYLNHNRMTGSLPKQIADLANLVHVRTEENFFSNHIAWDKNAHRFVSADESNNEPAQDWFYNWNMGYHILPMSKDTLLSKHLKYEIEHREDALKYDENKKIADATKMGLPVGSGKGAAADAKEKMNSDMKTNDLLGGSQDKEAEPTQVGGMAVKMGKKL